MIAKLHAYGFEYNALFLINTYLSVVFLKDRFSGHYYLIFILIAHITNYADDNTSYICDKTVELVIARLENDSQK